VHVKVVGKKRLLQKGKIAMSTGGKISVYGQVMVLLG
jgi:hypothetical protein